MEFWHRTMVEEKLRTEILLFERRGKERANFLLIHVLDGEKKKGKTNASTSNEWIRLFEVSSH